MRRTKLDNILELSGVSKKYNGSNFALNNVSFSLPRGSIIGYVGGGFYGKGAI